MRRSIAKILFILFAALTAYSGYRIWNIQSGYKKEAELHSGVMEYRPEPQDDELINRSVIDLQAKYPDVVGWLTVPGTGIDYPFVWHGDNEHYLRRDLNGGYAVAGTIFMDDRCEKAFTSQNTILYGHHMKNGSMFGTLKAFADKVFFDINRHATIYLPHETLTLEFFAYMIIKSGDKEIYSAALSENFIGYVRQNARHYRGVALAASDRIVTLSTCAYEFDNARMVLLARVA